MKKILFVTSLYNPHVGGIETMIRELSKRYQDLGFEVSVLTKKWPKELCNYEKIDNVSVYRVISAKSESEFVDLIEYIKTIENELKSDIVHVLGVRRPLPLIGLMLARKWSVPVLMTVAGGDIPDPVDVNPGIVWNQGAELIPDSMSQADLVNTVSNYLSMQTRDLFPNIKQVTTLYAGINVSEIKKIQPKDISEKFVFSLRRLDPYKGVHILIGAFNMIKDLFPELYLVIAGDGEEKNNLLQLAEDLDLQGRVRFVGTVSLSEGIAFLKSAEFTVVPSISEGGGLVNVEAQAAGCPVIASRVGGIPEYLKDGVSGLLFNCGDVNELANHMRMLLTDNVLRKKLIENGYVHADKFDWDNLVPNYIDLYKNLIVKGHKKEFIPWSQSVEKLWLKLIS